MRSHGFLRQIMPYFAVVVRKKAPRPVLDDHEDVQHAKARRDGDEEITGEDSLGMQMQESRPAQIPSRAAPGGCRGTYLHTVRGETRISSFNSSSLAMRSSPQWGFSRAIRRMRRCSSAGIAGRPGRGLQAPQQLPCLAVPAKQGLRMHDDQCAPPSRRAWRAGPVELG